MSTPEKGMPLFTRLTSLKKQGRLDIDWLRRLRQRSKISFSKYRYDNKLKELENRIQGLHRIRKHVMHIQYVFEVNQAPPSMARIASYRVERTASARLHEVLSSLWQCDIMQEHSAKIGLDVNDDRSKAWKPHFDIAWSCPGRGQAMKPLRLSVETFAAESHGIESASPHTSHLQHSLENALGLSVGHSSLSIASPASEIPNTSPLPDLCMIPNLCRYLGQRPPDATIHCAGFLQQSYSLKHVIYTPDYDVGQTTFITNSLEEELKLAGYTSMCIPLPEKLHLARLLALAVLRFNSTPWLDNGLRSKDILFPDLLDVSPETVRMPYLKSRVLIGENQLVAGHSTINSQDRLNHPRSPVRNQTLYSLGVLLVELAYNSPLQDLQINEDDQGDPHTLYWAALRLGERVWRELGQKYADAVKICLYGGFGASSDLDDARVQKMFFDEVVWKLERCAEAVAI